MQAFFDAFVSFVGGFDLAILILFALGSFLTFRFLITDSVVMGTIFLYPSYLLALNIESFLNEAVFGLPKSVILTAIMILAALIASSMLSKNGFFETYSIPTGFELILFSLIFSAVAFAFMLRFVPSELLPVSTMLSGIFLSAPWSLIVLFSPFIVGFVVQAKD
jgi:multisubunit Na+/H+ antiporter MnhC subunit